jgi:hypothetical protein
LFNSEESTGRAGFVAGVGAGFQWMILKQRGSSEKERNLEGIVKEVNDLGLRRVPARLPSASSLARRLLPLPAIRFFGCVSDGEGKLRLAEA